MNQNAHEDKTILSKMVESLKRRSLRAAVTSYQEPSIFVSVLEREGRCLVFLAVSIGVFVLFS